VFIQKVHFLVSVQEKI